MDRLIAASIDSAATRLVYARQRGNQSSVVIRSLATGAEQSLAIEDGGVFEVRQWMQEPWLRVTRIVPGTQQLPGEQPQVSSQMTAGVTCQSIEPTRDSSGIASEWLQPETRELRSAPPPDSATKPSPSPWLFEGHRLTWETNGYEITDVRTGVVTPLPGVNGDVSRRAGSRVAIGRALVDLATARVVGEFPGTAIAVDVYGRGLVPARAGNPKMGPLQWLPASERRSP